MPAGTRPNSASRDPAARVHRKARSDRGKANLEEAKRFSKKKEVERGLDIAQAALLGHDSKLRWLLLRAVIMQATEYVVEWQDEFGFTPLHCAIHSGQVNCARQLIKAGARIDVRDREGRQPLHLACFHGHTECVSVLIERAAALAAAATAAVAPTGGVPQPATVQVSSFLAPSWGTSRLTSPKLVRQLVSARDRCGSTPLHYACEGVAPPVAATGDGEELPKPTRKMRHDESECVTAALACLGAGASIEANQRGETPISIMRESCHRLRALRGADSDTGAWLLHALLRARKSDLMARWRRVAPLVGRIRRFLLLLLDEVRTRGRVTFEPGLEAARGAGRSDTEREMRVSRAKTADASALAPKKKKDAARARSKSPSSQQRSSVSRVSSVSRAEQGFASEGYRSSCCSSDDEEGGGLPGRRRRRRNKPIPAERLWNIMLHGENSPEVTYERDGILNDLQQPLLFATPDHAAQPVKVSEFGH